MPNEIQPREHSKGGGMGDALYILRNPNGNRNVLYLYRNDDGSWDWHCSWVDNDNWHADFPAAVLATHFISLPLVIGRVLFC